MHSDSKNVQNERSILEQLRLQASHVEELEQKIINLEQDRNDCQSSKQKFISELEHYRQVKAEGEWFFANSLDMLCILTPHGEIRRANNAFWRVLGYDADELLSQSIKCITHPDDVQKGSEELNNLKTGHDSINYLSRAKHKNGTWRWISWTCPALALHDSGLYFIGRDVTDDKLTQAELMFRSQHDSMTALANRAMFDQALTQAIARTERNSTNQVALLLIDLDGFKTVNDQHGHAAGDEVLKTVAAKFTTCQRRGDLVCRIGGDEFSWIVEGAAPLCLEPLAQRIIDLVREPIVFGDTVITIGCSIGIAVFIANGTDAHALYNQADAAMYSVKRAGKNGYARYETLG